LLFSIHYLQFKGHIRPSAKFELSKGLSGTNFAKMDFETQRKKRMEALDDKRKRLEEMRKMRKDRTESAEEVQENQQASVDERTQVDNLVNSLLVSTITEPTSEGIPAPEAASPR
jgi:hypothetical protein